ncbi:hypothetical protein BT63DRAFT_262961 [Microthyrium microscopicum]|uniref:Zn(2)-C6 fungal-type domain-containing protein n=1 Tax=Microthyrium microscopicum TaxID=703497 RepID=A0A6A6UEJ3_9PEZI|nr:hypothetical protein BT63DRAFT_262961 [Microthyrium microscopicum]
MTEPLGFMSFQPVMGREGNPAGSGPSQPPGGSSKPTYSKRGKITIVACVPCRRRKTKCDGKRPTCSQCQSRDGNCQYDMNEEQRRLTYLRENVETLAEEKNNLEQLLMHLRNSTEDESFEILRRIRGGAEPQSLVQQIQASRSLTQVKGDSPFSPASGSNPPSASFGPSRESYERLVQAITTSNTPDTDDIIMRLRRQEPIESIIEGTRSQEAMDIEPGLGAETQSPYYARPMAGNSLAPHLSSNQPIPGGSRAPDAHTPPIADDHHWTRVTQDKELIEHLLDTYFTWQHSFFQNFPEDLFRKDFAAGKTQFCSRVLVNAICAAGCLLSDRDDARGDPSDPTTAGAGFFEEGIRLLNQSDRSSIPTTAGVFILSHVEGYRARLGAMWGLVGRSARMALDLGLHLRNEKTPFDQMGPDAQNQETGRIHAFWGCFVSDQVTSLSLGRLPQLLTNAVTIELPPLDDDLDEQPWGPRQVKPGARASTFRQCAALSKIVNSTLLMFFAPSSIIKGKLLLDEYHKYTSWFERLPDIVRLSDEEVPPHVISLHIYYHAAVLLLFRPFLRAKFTESDIVPSELCRQSATAISELFAKHLSLYGTTGIYTFQIQCLLTACTIHLINLPAISSATALRAACEAFNDLVTHNTWALASIKLIKDLVGKWSVILPGDVEDALYRSHAELPTSLRERFDDPAAPQAELVRGAKRTAFLNPSQVIQKRARLAPVLSTPSASADRGGSRSGSGSSAPGTPPNATAAPGKGAGSGSGSGQTTNTTGSGATEHRTNQASFLFAPFPNQPTPLLGPIHTSRVADTDWHDELNRVAQDFDGLKFEGDGWFDPFMGI